MHNFAAVLLIFTTCYSYHSAAVANLIMYSVQNTYFNLQGSS